MAKFKLSAEDVAALDRPILSALTTKHRPLAQGGKFARRYPAEIAPFAALLEDSAAAASELHALATGGPVAILTPASATPPPIDGLEVKLAARVLQMVATGAPPPDSIPSADVLGPRDVPAMLELTALTKPGPFFPRTHELGRYIGIRAGGRLAAMAGERMRLDGFTEISAVCVHPDHRGRGYARSLVVSLMASIAEREERPFLHVYADNPSARTLYERLGFAARTTLNFTVLHTAPGAGTDAP